MALTKKILTKSSSLNDIKPGEKIVLNVDYCLINDAVSNVAVDYIKDEDKLFDSKKVVVVIDHDTPSGSEDAAKVQKKLIAFAKKHDTHFHHGEGVPYQILIDKYVKLGNIVVGCGRHTAVYGAVGAIGFSRAPEQILEVLKSGKLEIEMPEIVKVELTGQLSNGVYAKDIILNIIKEIGENALQNKIIEFTGDAFKNLTLNDKITICNLAGRTGAVSAVVSTEEVSDDDKYCGALKYDLSKMKSMTVNPDSFGEIVDTSSIENIAVNEVFIGGCSGGRIEDLRIAANILKGKHVAYKVRLIIAPITQDVFVQASNEGLISTFIDSGALVMNQGCSVCWGKSQGIIDTDEVLVSSGSCNGKGNAGAETAKIYVTSTAVAATSAITGCITAEKLI